MKLVIAEKPSVAATYSKVLSATKREDGYYSGNGYIVTWCVGHLVGLALPPAYDDKYKEWDLNNLPFVPEKWKYSIKQETAKQYKIVKELLTSTDVEEVICGTDAGREGELIFRHVYNMSGCKKPIKRLWVSSMEDSALKEGFNNLRSGDDYTNLYYAALARERIDYLCGMNFSPLVSLLFNGSYSVGRVQTPTLALIYQREDEIANFVKEKFYVVHIKKDGIDAVSERFKDKEEANFIKKACDGKEARVLKVEKKKKSVNTPLLYDLTSLQREANRMYGFTADKTLKLVQKLYEAKMLTYPRTDSPCLTEDMVSTAEEVYCNIKQIFDLNCDFTLNKQVFNNKKVSDHHAIIPTMSGSKDKMSQFSSDEEKIYSLVAMRFFLAFSTPYIYESTNVELECEGYLFKAKGNVVLDKGFKAIEEYFKKRYKADTEKKEKNDEDSLICIDLSAEQRLAQVVSDVSEGETKPPAHYTEDTLLAAMEKAGNKDMNDDVERKGLGTPATRAEILEKLVHREYVVRDKKNILITKKGIYFISIVPERMKSIELTVDMENQLLSLAKGNVDFTSFMHQYNDFIGGVIQEYSKIEIKDTPVFNGEAFATCPVCKSDVKESKTNYYCTNKECKVCLYKEHRYLESMGKSLTKKIASDFFNKGYSNIKGLVSKNSGKSFDAKVICSFDDNGQVSYGLEFNNGGKKK